MDFSRAVSGMNAASRQLEVIGNNIANSATTGFKRAAIAFGDLYAGSKIGVGVRVADVVQNFKDGLPTTTNNPLDVAISGNGFFRLVDSRGQLFYSRNGEFKLDKANNIVSMDGLKLTGYLASGNPAKIDQNGNPVSLRVDETMLDATATTTGSLQINLNSNNVKPSTPFDPKKSETFNYSTPITAYDSLGNTHSIQLFYVKTENNKWDVHYIDNSEPSAKPIAIGKMEFNSLGKLISEPVKEFTLKGLNGAGDNLVKLTLANSTQQNLGKEPGNQKSMLIDGYAAGNMVGYSINQDGTIYGLYSNQQTILLGQIVMANFVNVNGLEAVGNNNWQLTNQSGEERLGLAGSTGFGDLTSNTLESSNVDIGQELVNMIVAQRNYQSNSQSIKTQDQILNTLINLR